MHTRGRRRIKPTPASCAPLRCSPPLLPSAPLRGPSGFGDLRVSGIFDLRGGEKLGDTPRSRPSSQGGNRLVPKPRDACDDGRPQRLARVGFPSSCLCGGRRTFANGVPLGESYGSTGGNPLKWVGAASTDTSNYPCEKRMWGILPHALSGLCPLNPPGSQKHRYAETRQPGDIGSTVPSRTVRAKPDNCETSNEEGQPVSVQSQGCRFDIQFIFGIMKTHAHGGPHMSPRRAAPERKKRSGRTIWLIVGAVAIVAVVGVVIGVDLLMKSRPPGSGLAASGRTAGSAQAPITFVEYSDFQ